MPAPLLSLVLLAFICLSTVSGWYGWQWYSHLPKPHTVDYRLGPPALTDYSKTPIEVFPLHVHFCPSPRPPLQLINKPLQGGVRLDPACKGLWKWVDDRTLEFKPDEDWPIGTSFRLGFAKKRFFCTRCTVADL